MMLGLAGSGVRADWRIPVPGGPSRGMGWVSPLITSAGVGAAARTGAAVAAFRTAAAAGASLDGSTADAAQAVTARLARSAASATARLPPTLRKGLIFLSPFRLRDARRTPSASSLSGHPHSPSPTGAGRPAPQGGGREEPSQGQ